MRVKPLLMRLLILSFLAVIPGLVIGQDVKLSNTAEHNVVIRMSCGLGRVSEPPLFIVDGIMVENISYLKGEDIESILVFRDTALIHCSGKGIVLITTKHKDGKLAVVDAENCTAIPFVYVQVDEGGQRMMLSGDGKGRVDLKHLEKGRVYKLKISSVGYETQELDYELGAGPAKVKMKKEVKECERVVVEAKAHYRKCRSGWMVCNMVSCRYLTSGREEKTNVPFLRIFPNPAKAGGSLNVKIESVEEGEHTIRLIDMSGKVCMVKKIKTFKGNNNTVLQLDTRLAAGIYVISITYKENQKPYTQKLLIQ